MLHFAIIGAQKAGSTFIQEQIGAHPELYSPHGETPFFQDPDYTRDGFDPLIDQLAADADGRKIGVKRPNYLAAREVAERLFRHAPDCRLIAVLRDPRERAVSAYFHLMRSRMAPACGIETGLPGLLDGAFAENWPVSHTVLDYGKYGEHIEHWRSIFPPEQLLIEFYQDIKQDSAGVTRRAFEHLGVDPGFVAPPMTRRPMEGVYSLTRQRVHALINRIGQERYDDGRRFRPRRNPLARASTFALQGLDQLVLKHLFKASAPKPSPGLRQRLTDYYADDVRRLESLTGRDLTAWRTC